MKIFKQEVRLASKSPRRYQLLKESGFDVEVVEIDVEELWDDNMKSEQVAAYLAKLKGKAAVEKFGDQTLLLTADSVVVADGQILEKPRNEDEAHEMLRKLSNTRHEVHTGFCIQYKGIEIVDSVTSIVHMDELTKEERSYYIEEFSPYDKAGGYGIQEWIGHCKIKKIEGSYTNIVGLPMREVYRAFRSILS